MMHYLIRLDDACPFMDSAKWKRMEDILDKHGVKPLVGIIPSNADSVTMIEPEDNSFWEKVLFWKDKGWTLALHGYNHVCTSNTGGLNPVHSRSEFAGIPYEKQLEKITEGFAILQSHGVDVEWFFAPSHTFDENTLKAIKEGSTIKYISDTIACKPYRMKNGLTVVPCQMGRLRKMNLSGYWTACYHPNTMTEIQFEELDSFIKEHKNEFVSYQDLSLDDVSPKSLFDRILSICYFGMRKIKR